MKRHDKLAETIPYGTLGILALESSHSMGEKVNDYIVGWRAKRAKRHADGIPEAGGLLSGIGPLTEHPFCRRESLEY